MPAAWFIHNTVVDLSKSSIAALSTDPTPNTAIMIINNEAPAIPGETENYDFILSPFSLSHADRTNIYWARKGLSVPDLCISPSRIPADLDIHKAGEAIANNSSIKHIGLYGCGMNSIAGNGQHKALFDGIARSKSIKEISIHKSTLDQELSRVFHAQNVEVVKLTHCRITAETPASLRRCIRLQKIRLEQCKFSNLNDSKDRSIERELFDSMKHSPLQSLTLHCRDTALSRPSISLCGLVSLNELLSNRRSTLQELSLTLNCSDKDPLALASGLALCKSIKSLKLGNPKRYGWVALFRSLFTFLKTPGISLCKLDLSSCMITGVCAIGIAIELATHTSSLPSLKELDLSGIITDVSEDVWVEILTKVLGSNSALESLDLSCNNMSDGAAVALANTLVENKTLRHLDLHRCSRITVEGWMAFSRALSALNIDSALKKLDLSSNAINDSGITALANALANNETLEELDLSNCSTVTTIGWTAFSVLLRTNSVMKSLRLTHNHVAADHVVIAFADALRGNAASSLTALDISNPILEVDEEGEIIDTMIVMSNLLCDTSSIQATKFSNHTLCDLGIYTWDDDLDAVLKLNKCDDKSKVAHNKVIKCHFSGAFDVVALAGDANKLLPDSLSFLGKYELGLSALYTMLKSKPEVMEGINETTSLSH